MSKTNDELVLVDTHDGVTTLTLNNPPKLNAWTMPMLEALREAFEEAAERMLGEEGWKPTGQEAAEIGLADRVAPSMHFSTRPMRWRANGSKKVAHALSRQA